MDEQLKNILITEAQKTVRQPTAKVKIIWAGRSVDNAVVSVDEPKNRASIEQQTARGIGKQRRWAYTSTGSASSVALLRDNICVMPRKGADGVDARGYLVGWWGKTLTDNNGNFTPSQVLTVVFAPQTLTGFRLQGYQWQGDPYSEHPIDFEVEAYNGENVLLERLEVSGNTTVDYRGTFSKSLLYATKLIFKIQRWSHPKTFIKITAAFEDFSDVRDGDDIVSMSVLEETEGTVGTLPVGNISCNELDLSLQNLDDKYFIGNTPSDWAGAARSNRRLEPYFGFIDDDGNEHYAQKGVYWTRDWDMADEGTTASTSALDRLGLMQDIEYRGIGNIDNVDADAEYTTWTNTSLYNIANAILYDLQGSCSEMIDLEYSIDESLKTVMIPLAFFSKQSYFDVIKKIAQAGCAYAFMDIPTEAERVTAAARGNLICADVLRIKPLLQFTLNNDDMEVSEAITKRDYITKTTSTRRDNVANIINIPYAAYTMVDGKPEKADKDNDYVVTIKDDNSILEYGRIVFDFPENNLIQTAEAAQEIAEKILYAFSGSGAPRTCELETFGDITRCIGDIVELPEYQKNGIDTRGLYAITRLNTDFSSYGLRQSISSRWVGDTQYVDNNIIYNETGDADFEIDESAEQETNITEGNK